MKYPYMRNRKSKLIREGPVDVREQIENDLLDKKRCSHLDLEGYDEESDYVPVFGED